MSAEVLLERLVLLGERISAQLALLTLTSTAASGTIFLENPEAVALPNPATGARAKLIFDAKDQAFLVRVYAIGYSGGAVYISRSASGATSAARSPDTIPDGLVHSYVVFAGEKLYALGATGGGDSTVVMSTTPISKVST